MYETRTFYLFHKKTKKKVEVEAFQIGEHEWQALCPFHDDHKPSLCINDKKEVYICHGCGESGKLWNDDYYKPWPPGVAIFNIGDLILLEIEKLKNNGGNENGDYNN